MSPDYRYEIVIYWSGAQAFVAEVPVLRGCAAVGPTYRAALELAGWLALATTLRGFPAGFSPVGAFGAQ